jgi:hypothetical protein
MGHARGADGDGADDVAPNRPRVQFVEHPRKETLACPSCGKAMGTWKLHKVEIDRCEPHGIWFDRDELEHVLFATFVPAS